MTLKEQSNNTLKLTAVSIPAKTKMNTKGMSAVIKLMGGTHKVSDHDLHHEWQ
jgi:hypothetical protein